MPRPARQRPSAPEVDQPYPQASALIKMVMRTLNIDPDAEGAVPELARAVGVETRYVYRWANGRTRPSFDEAIRLLDLAGLLHPGVRQRIERSDSTPPGDDQLQLERRDLRHELQDVQRRLLELEQRL